MGYWGHGIFGMWNVQDVGCPVCGMFGMWNVRDVGCVGCGMLGTWDVGYLPGCEMLIYKMQGKSHLSVPLLDRFQNQNLKWVPSNSIMNNLGSIAFVNLHLGK